MSTDQFPDEMTVLPNPHQKSMIDLILSGPKQVELVWAGEPSRGKMFMQMVEHLRGDAASKFKVFIFDEQTLLEEPTPLSSAGWRQAMDRTKREKSDVQVLIVDSMGWSGVQDHHIPSHGCGETVIHDEACPLCDLGYKAKVRSSFKTKVEDAVRELTSREDARWLKTAVEVKPKNAPHGPQRKGRGGKTRRW